MEEDDAPEENGQIDRGQIERRIDDWQERIRALFGSTIAWAEAAGWTVRDMGVVEMQEELMRRFHIPARELPIIRLEKDAAFALFKPKGLWVIGANGRIDLYTSKSVFVLIDTAENFEPAQWMIYRGSETIKGRPFAPALLVELT
jgi:hypothetical protein